MVSGPAASEGRVSEVGRAATRGSLAEPALESLARELRTVDWAALEQPVRA